MGMEDRLARMCRVPVSGTVLGMSTDRFQQPASRPHGQDSLAERFQAQHTNEPQPEAEQVQPGAANAPRTHDAASQSASAEQGSGWGNPDASQPASQAAPSQYAPQQPQAQAPNFGQQPAAPAPGQAPAAPALGQQAQPGFPQQSYAQGGFPQQFQQNYQPGQPAQPGAVAMRFGLISLVLTVVTSLFGMAGHFALALADVEPLRYNLLIAVKGMALLTALGLAIAGLMNLQKSNTTQGALWVGLGLGAAGIQLLSIVFGALMSLVS